MAVAAMLVTAACSNKAPASFNAMGDDVVVVEADYPAGDVPATVRALSAKMAPSTVQKAPGGRYIFMVKASEKDRLVADLLEEKLPKVTVFEHPFYNFNREKATGEAPQKLLTHAVMTCNMVADPVKQSEYLDYHARQGELFPEVAQGFARAGYEQVLVFRDGRRLMLVISFPQGCSLSELDPLTTKDNPRVDDWNAIMAGYQENIDTPGEAPWMMFEPL